MSGASNENLPSASVRARTGPIALSFASSGTMKILAPASGLASGPITRPVNVPASFGSSGSEPAAFLGFAGAGCWRAGDETLRAAGRNGAAVIAVGRASASAAVPWGTSRVADAATPPASHAMLASHPAARQSEYDELHGWDPRTVRWERIAAQATTRQPAREARPCSPG